MGIMANYGIFLIMGQAGFCPSAVWGFAEIRGTLFGLLIIRILLFRVLY